MPWLPAALLDQIVQDHHAELGADSPYSSVLFTIATYFPAPLRPYADQTEDSAIRQALLSGADDTVADELLDRWNDDGDLGHLWKLALMPLAGRMPEGGSPAGYSPAFMGFVADKGASNHVIGGRYPGELPLCVDCGTPAERILTLCAADLPQDLSRDPSFFWFACECDEVDIITVRLCAVSTTRIQG